MVGELQVEHLQRLLKLVRFCYVRLRRARIPGWVIVEQDHERSVLIQGCPDNLSGVYHCQVQCTGAYLMTADGNIPLT